MKHLIIAFVLLVLQVNVSNGQNNALRLKHFNLDGKLAIEGYDPVAYFKQQAAVKGRKEWAVWHQDVVYYF